MVKKLDANIPSFDSELDFDFGTDISGELNQQGKSNKDRGVISNVARGTLSGAIDTAKDATFVKQTLRKALPKTYGEIADATEEVLGGTYQLYDQTVRELKPKMGSISRKLDSLVPEGQKTLKHLTGKMMDLTGESRNTSYGSGENQEEQAITTALGAIFQQNKQYTADGERKQIMRDTIDKKRSDHSLKFLNTIARNTSIQAQYTTNVTQAYQKKMLELQLRGYLAAKEHYALTSKFNQLFQAQNEAIVKNTSMPEYQKITNSERFMQAGKNAFFDGLYGEGSLIKKGMGRLKDTVGEILSGVGMGLQNTDMMLDQAISGKEAIDDMNKMLIEMGEPGLSKAEMLGAMAGGNVVEWLRDKLAPGVRDKLSKNKKFTERLGVIAKMATNPAGAIEELRKTDLWQGKVQDYSSKKGTAYRFLDAVLEHFREESPSAKFKGSGSFSGLNEPTMGFDTRAHVSLTEVIPGYLARIHQELAMSRTGKADTPLQVFDFKRKDFVTSKTMSGRIAKDLIKQARSGASKYEIEKTARDFGGTEGLNPTQDFELKLFFSKLARITDMDYTPENIRNTDVYSNLSPIVKAVVDTQLSGIEKSEDKEVDTAKLTKNIIGIRRGFPAMEKSMDSYVKAGYGAELERLGMVKRDEDGDYERDEAGYAKHLEKYGIHRKKPDGMATSDINVKESIKQMRPTDLLKAVADRFSGKGSGDFVGPQRPGLVSRAKDQIKNWNPKQAYEGLKKTKLFDWKYKAGEGDGDQHFGPMAQDVNRNLGEESAPGGKKIDLVNINGAAMAAVKHLGGEVEKLGFWKSGNPLTMIQKDVAKLVQLAGGKRGRGRKGQPAFAGGAAAGGNYSDGEGYDSLLGNMVQSITKLGTQVGSDIFGAAGKTFSFGKDKVAKPVIDYIQKSFNDKDHPVRKGISTMFEKATKMAGDVMDFGTKMVNETLPAGWKQLKDIGKKVYEDISKRLNEARDLYLPGGAKPIIRAIKLRSGFYRDSVTGEPIFTMDNLLKCKNDIVDAAGNVVLSVEEKAQGLIDSHGEKVKTTFMNVVNAGIGLAFAAKDKAVDAFKFLREKGAGAFGAMKDKVKGQWDKFDGSNFGAFGGKYLKDGYQVWVDIRDILLGDADKVRERLHKKESDGPSPSFGSSGGSGSGSASDDHEENEAAEADPSERYGSSGGSSSGGIGGMFDKAKGAFNGLRDRGVAALNSDGARKAGGKLRHLRNKAKGKYHKLKNAFGKTKFGEQAGDQLQKLKGSGLATKASEKWNALKGSKFAGKVGGGLSKLKIRGKGLLGAAGSLASGLLGGGGEEAGAEAQHTDAASDPNRAKEVGEGKDSELKLNKGKGKVSLKDRVFGDKDGDGDKDGSVDDQKDKQEALKESRKKKAAEADLSLRYKENGGGFFDKLLAGASGIFSLVTSGLSGMFNLAGSVFKMIPGLGKIASVASKGVGTILGTAGKVGWGVAKFVGRNALRAAAFTALEVLPAVASGAMAVAGTAISAIGSVLSAPVVLGAAALALTGYGLYKLYKYANRDNASDLERVRLRQYGVSRRSNEDKYNHLFYTLEAYLCDGRVGYNQGQAYIIDKNVKPEDIAEIFGVDKDDGSHGDAVATWYSKRFKPFFLTNLTALYAADPKKKLSDIDSLTTEQQLKYLSGIGFESGPWNIDTSPIKAIDSLEVDSSETVKAVEILTQKLAKQDKKDSSKTALPTKSQDQAGKEAEQAQADYGKALREKEQRRAADKAVDRRNPATPGAAPPSYTPTGEDGPKPETPKQLESKGSGSGVGSSAPMAPGGPLDGSGGMQYLKLGKGVNIDKMHPGTLKMLLGMAEEYGKATGKSIQVNDGFRSFEEQAALHSKYPEKAAAPGKSLHEYGLAVDVNSADADALEKMGLLKKYGFTRPVGGEPWHMEPAGIQRNIDLARKNPGERDTMVGASFFKGGGGYGTLADAKKYRRNHELAMKLLELPGKEAKEKLNENKDAPKEDKPGTPLTDSSKTPTSVGTDGKSVSTVVPKDAIKEAANDSTSKTNVFSLSDKASTSNNLPNPETAGKAPAADDQEGKKESSEGTQASKGSSDVKDVITKSAKRAGGDANMMLAFAAVESDMNPNAKSKTGSAAGAFGFMPATWKELLGKHGSKYSLNSNASPYDAEAATLMATEYVKTNLKGIGSVKSDPNFTDAYLTHFLGPSGARRFLKADPNAIAADVVSSAAQDPGNKGIFYEGSRPRTIKEVYELITNRLKAKASTYGINVKFGSLGSSGAPAASSAPGMGDSSGTGVKGGLPNTPSAEPVPTKDGKGAAPDQSTGGGLKAPASAPSSGGRMIPSSSTSSGVFVDSRGNSPAAVERRESGQQMAGPSMTKLEASFDKSLGIQEDQLSVLKDILSEVKVENIAKVLAAAIASMNKGAENTDKGSVKEQDKANMGRKGQAASSSLDMSRRSM